MSITFQNLQSVRTKEGVIKKQTQVNFIGFTSTTNQVYDTAHNKRLLYSQGTDHSSRLQYQVQRAV